MADSITLTFRPRNETEGDYRIIDEWCRENGISFSAVLNAYIPAISYALTHQCFKDEGDGKMYIRSDFGDVPLIVIRQGRKREQI